MAQSLRNNESFQSNYEGYSKKMGFIFKQNKDRTVQVIPPKQRSLTILSLMDFWKCQKDHFVIA